MEGGLIPLVTFHSISCHHLKSFVGEVVENLKTELRETVVDLKQHEQEMEEAYEAKVKALEEKILSQEANLATNAANAKAFEAMVANKIQTNKDNIASTGCLSNFNIDCP